MIRFRRCDDLSMAPAEQQRIRRTNTRTQNTEIGRGIEQTRIPAVPIRQKRFNLIPEAHRFKSIRREPGWQRNSLQLEKQLRRIEASDAVGFVHCIDVILRSKSISKTFRCRPDAGRIDRTEILGLVL